MRVIAGRFKGRTLQGPRWEGLRPTSDKLRETLFNVLAPAIAGARVLDAYAGTGAMGIEALSRGAAHVTFVEDDRRATALIQSNLERLGVTSGYAIIRDRIERAARRLRAEPPYAVIVVDPPYALEGVGRVIAELAPLLDSGGWLVVEHAARRDPDGAASLRRVRTIRSGDSALTVFTPASGAASAGEEPPASEP